MTKDELIAVVQSMRRRGWGGDAPVFHAPSPARNARAASVSGAPRAPAR